jgi:N-acetyl-alpha-D-muramate 1-phosphate uridylyltransferase
VATAPTAGAGLAAVVLAAGVGTRLLPLTRFLPKALCPVGNRPLVDLAVERARSVGRRTAARSAAGRQGLSVADVAVNVHHGHAALRPHLAGLGVHVSVEQPVALGTAGALGQLRGWIGGRDVLVLNADAWFEGDLEAFVAGWDRRRIRLLCVHDPPRGDFGPLRYSGAALMPWSAIRALEPVPSGLYERCWRQEAERSALDLHVTEALFIDCGSPADYLTANLASSGGAPVVGAGARVDGECVRCVVWPGGRVAADEHLVDAIRVGATLTVRPGPFDRRPGGG